MTVNRGRGIIDTPSNHSVDETVEKLKGILQAKGSYPVRAGRPQWRSGKSWNENVSHQAADFRESESRHSRDAGGAQ